MEEKPKSPQPKPQPSHQPSQKPGPRPQHIPLREDRPTPNKGIPRPPKK